MRLWLLGFLGTLLVESPVYVWGLRRRLGLGGALGTALAVNAVTHPLAWRLTLGRSWTWYVAVELGVWLVEAALVVAIARALGRTLRTVDAVLIALAANALSAGLGLIVFTAA